jgi:short-subunit dehydrogenase
MRIKGSVAVVTGAGGGIGRATAVALGRAGAAVGLVGRSGPRLESVRAELEALGVRAVSAPCDVRDPTAVSAAHQAIATALGPVDLLVHAAGIGVWKPFLDVTVEEHRAMMDTMYWGGFHWARALLPGMRERRRGRLVFISAGSGRFAMPVTSGYSAAAFALTGFSEALHRELLGSGVGVSCLNPGSVRTGFWNDADIPPAGVPPLVRLAPRLSPAAVARNVLLCIRLGLASRTLPLFVALLARANALWIRLGDLILWRWFVPILAAILVVRVLGRLLG